MRRLSMLAILVTSVCAAAAQTPGGNWQQPGEIQKPGEIQRPTGSWFKPGEVQRAGEIQKPGEIQRPTGPWITPGEIQKAGEIQKHLLVQDTCLGDLTDKLAKVTEQMTAIVAATAAGVVVGGTCARLPKRPSKESRERYVRSAAMRAAARPAAGSSPGA